MATYAIGDLQGCLTPLLHLLDKLRFDDSADKLWFVGDLVNRGPESLEALRFVRSLGSSAVTVLGNHDLHLLAVMHGVRKPTAKDTLNPILDAKDRDELEHWLRRQPLLHTDHALGHTLVHAGIHPHWSLSQAEAAAADLAELLPSEAFIDFLQQMYGNTPDYWHDDISKQEQRRLAINVFTRMRYCTTDGRLNFECNTAPAQAPDELLPWYAVPNRVPLPTTVVFGHWSSHPAIAPTGIVPTDRGCVWGGTLAAYHIEQASSICQQC